MGKRWDDARWWKEAQRKADRLNQKAYDEAPLFADQLPKTDAQEQYWRHRFMKARYMEGACGVGYDEKLMAKDWQIALMMRLARELMDEQTYTFLVEKDWKGDEWFFWRDVLTGGKRIVAKRERISHGWKPVYFEPNQHHPHGDMCYVEQVELREACVWPPEGWTPPITKEELDEILEIPPPLDHPKGEELDQQLQKFIEAIAQKA